MQEQQVNLLLEGNSSTETRKLQQSHSAGISVTSSAAAGSEVSSIDSPSILLETDSHSSVRKRSSWSMTLHCHRRFPQSCCASLIACNSPVEDSHSLDYHSHCRSPPRCTLDSLLADEKIANSLQGLTNYLKSTAAVAACPNTRCEETIHPSYHSYFTAQLSLLTVELVSAAQPVSQQYASSLTMLIATAGSVARK